MDRGTLRRNSYGSASDSERVLSPRYPNKPDILRSLQALESTVSRIEMKIDAQHTQHMQSVKSKGLPPSLPPFSPHRRQDSSDGLAFQPEQTLASGAGSLAGSADTGVSVQTARLLRSESDDGNSVATEDLPYRKERTTRSRNGGAVRMTVSAKSRKSTSKGGLDPSWPSDLRLRDGLQSDLNYEKINLVPVGAFVTNMSIERSYRSGLEHPTSIWSRWFPIDPDSLGAVVWDWLRLLVLLYEAAVTPVMLAWQLETDRLMFNFEVVVAVFFIFDCIMSFLIGYFDNGHLIMSKKRIVFKYLRTWFMLDFSLIVSDWLGIIIAMFDVSLKDSSLRQVLFIAGAVRCFKLLRLGKIAVRFKRLAENAQVTTGTGASPQLVTTPFVLLLYNHVVCCLWGLIGRLERQNLGNSWLDEAGLSTTEFPEVYLTSLHWTIAQMTPGPIGLSASTDIERAFNCVVLICGLLYGSMIISLFSGHIMQYTVMQRGKMHKFEAAQAFLRQRGCRSALAARVRRQLSKRIFELAPLTFEQVSAFDLLNKSLHQELVQELRLPPLIQTHTLFQIWWSMGSAEVIPLANTALHVQILLAQEELFTAGSRCNQAYLHMKGKQPLTYTQIPGFSFVFDRMETKVEEKSWMCEAALWCLWVHVGTLEGAPQENASILALDADKFMKEITKADTPGRVMMQYYGRQFHLRVVTALPPFATFPTDLYVPDTDVASLCGTRVGISLLNMALDDRRICLSERVQDILMSELQEEKCALRQCADGNVERLVAIVTLRLTDADKRVLVQLAKYDTQSGLKTYGYLPGIKRRASELQEQAFERLLQHHLPGLADAIVLESTRMDVKQADSIGIAGIQTLYQRAETLAFFDGFLPESWHVIPAPTPWMGVNSIYRVHSESEKAFFIYAWLAPGGGGDGLDEEALDKLLERDGGKPAGLQQWLSRFQFETWADEQLASNSTEADRFFLEGVAC